MNETDLDDTLDDHLSEVLSGVGEMVVKWVTIAEVVDDEGRRWLRTLTSPGAGTWDRMGLLGYALAEEQAIAASGQS